MDIRESWKCDFPCLLSVLPKAVYPCEGMAVAQLSIAMLSV